LAGNDHKRYDTITTSQLSVAVQGIVVIDIGKTLSKASLWGHDGRLISRLTRPNDRVRGPGYLALDAAGIETWLAAALTELGKTASIDAIVPVAHGAAVAVVRDGGLQLPPVDYENPINAAVRARYDAHRDRFDVTGSPALPDGLNLGVQIHLLESLHPEVFRPGTWLIPWPQYWAWRLCGEAASEVTSLGCHTDLWSPVPGEPSEMAHRRGWAEMLPPPRWAGDCLGTLTREWVARTGLSPSVRVHCGIHDSNAALLAARGFPEIAAREATVLSTGTWFVAMRSPTSRVDLTALPEHRDCLVNVDADGHPVPSARFMGGREIETLTGIDTRRIDIVPDQPQLVTALPRAIEEGAQVLPTFAAGFGPFPHARGRWVRMPADEPARRAAVSLYAALVADVSLGLIGARERILVEGRFAQAQVFVRALASLRPDTNLYIANIDNDVSYGALRLIKPRLRPSSDLQRVQPLDVRLDDYRDAWHDEAMQMEVSA
jgi:sugar (pentulose or hexulose) kinase